MIIIGNNNRAQRPCSHDGIIKIMFRPARPPPSAGTFGAPCAQRAYALRYPSRHGDASQRLAPGTGKAIQPERPKQGEGWVRLGREGPRSAGSPFGGGGSAGSPVAASPRPGEKRSTSGKVNLAPATAAGPSGEPAAPPRRPANRRPRLGPRYFRGLPRQTTDRCATPARWPR